MIGSNVAITGIFKVVRESYTLAQGWQKWATGKQSWNDSLKMINWEGFEQLAGLISFRAMKQQFPQ
jgi:hypothetical protein